MALPVERPALILAEKWKEYQILESGDGMKQEKWGAYSLVRPDPQIIWPKSGAKLGSGISKEAWSKWDGFYHRSTTGGGEWEYKKALPDQWEVRYDSLGLKFKIKPTSFKHTGLFPEQAVNWEWFSALIKKTKKEGREVSVLNLFGYTGAATCAAAKAGASVCHVDAAEGMVKWCRENAALSGLADAPIRYIVDDCLKFVRREQKRGKFYDAVIMDPPTYGRGAAGEMWKLEDSLWPLLEECRNILTPKPLFFLLNAYTARLSPTVVSNLLGELFVGRGGSICAGEVGIPIQKDGKVLPCGIYGRWEA
jgi:23S rRNA (cytosine1962-C5)-methyltransferase